MHPDYVSTKFAQKADIPVIPVQHHYAHVAACMAENEIEGSVLGVAWDGTGFGPDGTVWGGEFLLTNRASFDRIASFRRFMLPGGTSAVREPRRTALGILFEIMGDRLFKRDDLLPNQSFLKSEIPVIAQILRKGLHSPWTSSVGRIFDAVASILGLCQVIRFEGQAAMKTEFAIGSLAMEESYPFTISDRESTIPCHDGQDPQVQTRMTVDWEPMMLAILEDVENAVPTAQISAKFHNALAEIIVEVAIKAGEERVVLTGGCFQNKYLLERTVLRLREKDFKPYWHQRIPTNDGGIAPGQIVAVSRLLRKKQGHNTLFQ